MKKKKKNEGFKSHPSDLHDDFDLAWNKYKSKGQNDLPKKRIQTDTIPEEEKKVPYRKLIYEVIDVNRSGMKNRFKELPSLMFISMEISWNLHSRKIHEYKKTTFQNLYSLF